MIRLFVADDLSETARVGLGPDQSRYLTVVMRQAPGDEVLLFNGRDGEWLARIGEVSRKACTLGVERRTLTQTPTPDLELVVALVKRARLEAIVEKATELGVRRIRLAITQRTNAGHTNVARLQAICVEAAEQTGRLDVPPVLEPQRLDRLLDGWEPPRRMLFCDEAGGAPPVLRAVAAGGPWAVLIGPEGGFSPDERARLLGEAFVTAASLGPRILRADTAAISALTLWQAQVGDWTS